MTDNSSLEGLEIYVNPTRTTWRWVGLGMSPKENSYPKKREWMLSPTKNSHPRNGALPVLPGSQKSLAKYQVVPRQIICLQ